MTKKQAHRIMAYICQKLRIHRKHGKATDNKNGAFGKCHNNPLVNAKIR